MDYGDTHRARALPEDINLVRPSEDGRQRLRKLFAETSNARVVLLI